MNHEKVVMELELDDILPNRFQPRFKFNEQAITELAESIKEHGVINPILVRRLGDKYEIIAGERRYKASVLAGKTTIPAIISDLNDKDSAEIALIENVQRQDLTPIEEAVSYRKILDMGYLTQEQLAEKLGKNQSTISNKLRLLNLADEVQEALINSEISERHARSLLKIDSKLKQKELLQRIIKERLTVKKTDDLINSITKGSNVEVPSILMNNSVQVEPAIQSSSAIEMINEQPNVVNSFNNSESESDLVNFLNKGNKQDEVIKVPQEANDVIQEIEPMSIPEIEEPVNDIDSVISTSPIVEEVEDIAMPESKVNSNEKEIAEINDLLNSIPAKINPGFVDVDSIEKNAQDIYVEKPLADLDNLLMSANGENPDDDKQQLAVEETETTTSSDAYSGNKFFTMVEPNEFIEKEEPTEENNEVLETQTDNTEPKEEVKNEEVFNEMPTIESFSSFDDFLKTEEPKEEVKTENIEEKEESNIQEQEISSFDDLNETFEEIEDVPKTINYPADNNLAESVKKEPVLEQNISYAQANPNISAINIRTVINTIRNCAETIEKYGFKLDCEEFDFDDMYQVIFKIQKKD